MIIVEYPTSGALLRRCQELRAVTRPGSRALGRAKEDYRLIIAEDHYHMMLRGVDRYGKARAPLAERTLRDKRRGPGPSLIPSWWRSRFIFNVQVRWVKEEGDEWLVKRFVGIVNKRGQSFAQYHFTGAKRGNWVLPRRDVGGVTPAGYAQLKMRFQKFVYDMATYEAGRGI